MKKYPLKLNYTAKSALWGGNTLSEKWNKVGNGDNVAETWELTVREKEMSKITNGEAEGMTLREYFDAVGYSAIAPDAKAADRFPLLVKFIDAGDRLSVQVHPDDEYAHRVEKDSGKTEMWYIVDANEGAEIIYGLAEGVDSHGYTEAVRTGRIFDAMKRVKVKKGESYFIPAGMIHAIGAGILVAEIQQNSDLTYRVYDYDRVGADGKKRDLHTEKALDVVRQYTDSEIDGIRFSRGKDDGLLANGEYFKVRKLCVSKKAELTVSEQSFTSILCVDGEGSVEHDGESYKISRGDSFFCPAGMGRCSIYGELTLICSEL